MGLHFLKKPTDPTAWISHVVLPAPKNHHLERSPCHAKTSHFLPKMMGFTWFYRTYPLEMEVLYGFMGKSWEYMGIPSGKLT